MNDLPLITIVMTTLFEDSIRGHERFSAAIQALKSWDDMLYYQGDIHLHIADDGSGVDYHIGDLVYFDGVTYSQQEHHGVGASLNTGFSKAFETSPLVLYMVDDWMLTEPFDLTPWAELLLEREDVGMARLGPPHPGIRGDVEMFNQGWGLVLDGYGFAFGHRPALYHRRMIDAYGWFSEDTSALECERLYNEKYAQNQEGPDIVLALPHPWRHIESYSMSSMEPKK